MCKHWMISLLFVIRFTAGFTQPALIPLPQKVVWNASSFLLSSCKSIVVKDVRLLPAAKQLKEALGLSVPVVRVATSQPHIEIRAAVMKGYKLTVANKYMLITGNVFYALQTLQQLIKDGSVAGCSITDYPAYAWRGYMVDVGRNFQSLPLLKQQIDQMARYKLNIFHFHLTEDIAWRLQIKQYPQLTDSMNMLRDKGAYYSIQDLKDLIAYCRAQHITLVPEIDMPGHSAAFKRAMGVDMQSNEGLVIIKSILREICTTYDVPYIHIGADEVHVRNGRFLPEVTALIRSYGKQVIGWSPGGRYDSSVIRQLWKDEPVTGRFIESRSLYISDMDPLNCVVSLFQRNFGARALGAEFCLWSDRRMAMEADLLRMNPVYPAMLAFAERSWRGGGSDTVAFKILDTVVFADFERRLLAHKGALPFPYVKQTGIYWTLYKDSLRVNATGGTIWLWHTNSPAVKAWLPAFTPNTIWYAAAEFYSDADTVAQFWIDGKDQSRSGADATPPAGKWDYLGTRFWLNDSLIAPPLWRYAGRRSGLLEEPLVDEAYYYRPPMVLAVKKGWNKVVVQLPVKDWDKRDWQVPPKWMFTFVPVRSDGRGQYEWDDRLRFRR